MNINTSIFMMDIINYNFQVRHKAEDNNFFQNISKQFIKNKYLNEVNKLKNNIDIKIKNKINNIYNDIINSYYEYLNNVSFDELIEDYYTKNNTIIFYNNDNYIFTQHITIYNIINCQFSKGIDFIILLKNYINGISYINNKILKPWITINNYKKAFLIKKFIISYQVFGDGNHRTCNMIDKYFNNNITNEQHNLDIETITNNRFTTNIILPVTNNYIEQFENNWIDILFSNSSL